MKNFEKPLLPLLRSTSEKKLSPTSFYTKKKFWASSQISSDDEKEVEKLNQWERRGSKFEILNSITEATLRLNKRITRQDIVEDIIAHRKLKKRLPNIKPSNIINLTLTSRKRQAKKENEQMFKDRCKYFRLFEEELKNNYTELCSVYEEYKQKRNETREQCCEIKQKASEALQAFEKLKEEFNSLEYTGKTKDSEELNAWQQFRNRKFQEMKIKEEEKKSFILEINEELKLRQANLSQLDDICKNLRKKMNLVKTAQVKHFLNLLKEGKDTRSEGLQWLVIALWKLNQTVSIDDFPPFLDEAAVHCVLFIAQRTLEIEEIIENILNPAKKSTIIDQRSEKVVSIKERLLKLQKNVKAEQPEYVYDKKNKQMVVKWVPFDVSIEKEQVEQNVQEDNVYENYVGKIKQLLQSTKESEVNRLALECFLYGYEEKFKVELKELVSAIVGAEDSEKYLAVTLKEKKRLMAKIESARTFNFTSKG